MRKFLLSIVMALTLLGCVSMSADAQRYHRGGRGYYYPGYRSSYYYSPGYGYYYPGYADYYYSYPYPYVGVGVRVR